MGDTEGVSFLLVLVINETNNCLILEFEIHKWLRHTLKHPRWPSSCSKQIIRFMTFFYIFRLFVSFNSYFPHHGDMVTKALELYYSNEYEFIMARHIFISLPTEIARLHWPQLVMPLYFNFSICGQVQINRPIKWQLCCGFMRFDRCIR